MRNLLPKEDKRDLEIKKLVKAFKGIALTITNVNNLVKGLYGPTLAKATNYNYLI